MTIARRYVSSAKGDEDVLVISLGDRAGIEAATELHTELEGAVAGGSRRVIVELPRALAVDALRLDRFFRIERSVSDAVAAFGPHRVGLRTTLARAHVSMEP